MSIIAAYLILLFCSLATYSMFSLSTFHNALFAYGTALLNASVIAKVIIVGQKIRAGTMFERKALMYSSLWKAAVFAGLVFAFHVVEEVVRDLMHGADGAGVFHDIRIQDLLIRAFLIFCAFIPLFVFLELRRVLGETAFRSLLFDPASTSEPPSDAPPRVF